jgi:Rap1a immunity proteins
MKRVGLAACLLSIFITVGNCDEMTGGQLYELCTSKVKEANAACSMWILGYVRGIAATRQAPKSLTPVCPPPEATGANARLVIENYLRKDPQVHNLPAAVVAYGALGFAYPCPPTRNSN